MRVSVYIPFPCSVGLSSDDEFGEEDLQSEQKQPSSVGVTRRRSSSISGGREEERDRPKGEGSCVNMV